MTVTEFINKIGFKVNNSDVKKVNDTISGIKSTATKLLGAIGIGFSLTNMNALVEEFDAINDKINYAVSGLGDAKEVQRDILAAANDVKTSYSDMANVVTNLVKANSDMFPVEDAINFSTNLTKLMKTAGRNDAEIASIMDAMNKSFQKGTVDVATLNRLLEQAPEAANYLADRLGVAKTQLLQMATEGTITITDLKDAFVESSDEIDIAFNQLNFSISDALLNIRNKWGFWLKDTDEMLSLTTTIGKVMVKGFDMAMSALNRFRNGVVWLMDKLGGTENVMKLLGIIAGVVFGGKALNGLMAFIKGFQSLDKAALSAKLKMMAIIAVIVLIALLVEDFINFMQGNDSVIGTLLERAGVDCDKFRKDIIKIWENAKTILAAIWLGIKNVAIPVFQGIWQVIKTVFGAIGKVIEAIAPKFADFISELANGNVDTEKWVSVGEVIAKIGVAIVGVIAVVKTAIAIVNAVTGAMQIASAVIAFLTSPIGLVIAAIAALIAIGVLLWQNWDAIKAFAISAWTGIKDFISETATNIWNGLTSTFTNIWNSIVQIVGNIKDSIVEGFQAAIDWITSLPAQALQWGADIIQGIVDGIMGSIGKVGEAVAGVADKIKSFIGFSEPEDGPLSNFHTYMPDMIQLMSEGIQKGKSVVGNAIRDLTGDMSDDVQDVDIGDDDEPKPKKPKGGTGGLAAVLGLVGDGLNALSGAATPRPSTVSTVTGSNNVSRSVVQNIEINNKYEGDRAGQQKSSQAAKEAGKDITSELARGLSYAR